VMLTIASLADAQTAHTLLMQPPHSRNSAAPRVLLRPARILVLTLIHKNGGAHREGVPWRKRLYSIDKKPWHGR
jgi:hypothetical protein